MENDNVDDLSCARLDLLDETDRFLYASLIHSICIDRLIRTKEMASLRLRRIDSNDTLDSALIPKRSSSYTRLKSSPKSMPVLTSSKSQNLPAQSAALGKSLEGVLQHSSSPASSPALFSNNLDVIGGTSGHDKPTNHDQINKGFDLNTAETFVMNDKSSLGRSCSSPPPSITVFNSSSSTPDTPTTPLSPLTQSTVTHNTNSSTAYTTTTNKNNNNHNNNNGNNSGSNNNISSNNNNHDNSNDNDNLSDATAATKESNKDEPLFLSRSNSAPSTPPMAIRKGSNTNPYYISSGSPLSTGGSTVKARWGVPKSRSFSNNDSLSSETIDQQEGEGKMKNKLEIDRLEVEKLERLNLENERVASEKLEKINLENERIESERLEKERIKKDGTNAHTSHGGDEGGGFFGFFRGSSSNNGNNNDNTNNNDLNDSKPTKEKGAEEDKEKKKKKTLSAKEEEEKKQRLEEKKANFYMKEETFYEQLLEALFVHLSLPAAKHEMLMSSFLSFCDDRESNDFTNVPPDCYAQALLSSKENNEIVPWVIMQDMIRLSVCSGYYDSRSRSICREVVLLFPDLLIWRQALMFESQLGHYLLKRQIEVSEEQEALEREERERKLKRSRFKKYALVGAAAVGGGVIIGVTAGLAAPFVAVGAGAVFGTSAGAFFATTGGITLTTSLFTTAGISLGGHAMSKRMADLKEFNLMPLNNEPGHLHVKIAITGWVSNPDEDFSAPWSTLDDFSEKYCVRWESQELKAVGIFIKDLAISLGSSYLAGTVIAQTTLATLAAAVALPVALFNFRLAIDNPWARCMERAEKAGLVLADVLTKRQYGQRPVVLVGHSFGARAIFHALLDLAGRENPCFGIVDSVYLFGAPVGINKLMWNQACSVVSGTVYNCYHPNDLVLGLCYRTTSIAMDVAGITPIELKEPIVKNIDVSDIVEGHLDYMNKMPQVLDLVGLS